MLLVTPNHFYIVKNKKRGYFWSNDFVACVSYRASFVTNSVTGHNLKAGCVGVRRLRDGTHHTFESSRKRGFFQCQA